MLQGDGAPRGHDSRTLGLRVPHNRGRGGGSSRGTGGSKWGADSRGGGGRATRSLFVGSLPEGAAGSKGRGGGRAGGRGGTASADDAVPFGGDNMVDFDEENSYGGAQNVEVTFPSSEVICCTHPLLHAYVVLM